MEEGSLEKDRPIRLADGPELDALLDQEDLVLLELYTSNCGICASMEPVLGIVARETDATVAMLNPGDDLSQVDRFSIQSVPTLVLFENGEEVGRLAEGFVESNRLVEFVENRGEVDARNMW